MRKLYTFDAKAFNNCCLPILSCICASIMIILNVATFINRAWTACVSLVYAFFTFLILFGIYIQRRRMWKYANIEFKKDEIKYYRRVKDGYRDGSAKYEFEERFAFIKSICEYSIHRKRICITGDIVVFTYFDEKHKTEKQQRLSSIKIPFYFGRKEELLADLDRYCYLQRNKNS